MIKKTINIVNPLTVQKPSLIRSVNSDFHVTLEQSREVLRVTNDIIGNMDDHSVKLLYDASEQDIDRVLDVINEEVYAVMYGGAQRIKETSINYLERLAYNVEEVLRCESFNYFIQSMLPNFELNWHHLEWGAHAQAYKKLCIIAPRDHGKSFFFSNAYPIWKLYRYKENELSPSLKRLNDANKRGFIITNEMELAEDLLEILKGTIEDNAELRERLMPDSTENWSKRSIRCKNGSIVRLKSYGGSFRGRHPGWAIVDDFLKDNVLYSETQRKKAISYFHSVIENAVVKYGDIKVVGTPFHENDLYGDLKKKKSWRVFEYPAITPDGKVLWRSRYSFKDLMEKRASQGNMIFSRELLVRPITSESSLFPYEILKRSFLGMSEHTLVKHRDNHKKQFSKVVTACDLARSANVGADFSVFGTWGIDDDDNMWLLHLWRARGRSYREQINVIKQINANFRPNIIVIEANQFQSVMADIAKDEGLTNVQPHTTTGQNKHDFITGVPGMSILFEKGKIKLPRGDKYSVEVTDALVSEFGSIAWTDKGVEGVGEHDDMAMQTWLATVGARKIGVGFGYSFL